MSKRIRRSSHSTNITTAKTKPREGGPTKASIAENLNTLRATVHNRSECPGCGKTDTEAKLVIKGFAPHHPKCYQKLVAEWPA